MAEPAAESPPDADSLVRKSKQTNEDQSGRLSPKKHIKRAMEKTVDKLGRSWSARVSQNPRSPVEGHRRILSLSRKEKAKARPGDLLLGSSQPPQSHDPSSQSPHLDSFHNSPTTSTSDDSPFISPPSPPSNSAVRPSLQAFRGDGTMRPGTQTLIQALQAIPWARDSDNSEGKFHYEHSSPESEGEEDTNSVPLASSIHAIHRPVARSRRFDAAASGSPQTNKSSPEIIRESEEPDVDGSPNSEDESVEDFETAPQVGEPEVVKHFAGEASQTSRNRIRMIRSASMGTVKIQRRARLAEKLGEVFELQGIEEVWAELPCWLLRSVLLQGYMYLTNTYLCFFAHMPSAEDQVLKSGSLNKRASRTKRWIKHWFILKKDAMSWYRSSSDPYFPHGILDLRYAISCEPLNEKDFRVRTNQKTIVLSADSVPSRDEWVKAVRKVMFKAQNMGDSVKIAIPYSVIIEVDKSSAMDFSETIEVKVFDKDEEFSMDSYFFAYFQDLPVALDQIRDAVRAYRTSPQAATSEILDTTHIRALSSPPPSFERTRTISSPNVISKLSQISSFSFTSLLKPFQDTASQSENAGSSRDDGKIVTRSDAEDFMHISKRTSFIPFTSSPQVVTPPLTSEAMYKTSEKNQESVSSAPATVEHTYPPSSQPQDVASVSTGENNSMGYWNVGVPLWLRGSTKKIFSMPFSGSNPNSSKSGVSSVYCSVPSGQPSNQNDLGYSVLETPETGVDPEISDKFHSLFAFDERETLLGFFTGYIYRLLPVYGRLYVSTNYFCFRSSGPLTTKTWMILPIRDVLSLEKSKAARFGHHGLIIIVKGHEELFFEFTNEERRTAFANLVEHQTEDVRTRLAAGDVQIQSPGKREALILQEFVTQASHDSEAEPSQLDMGDSLPAIMFTSDSSTFLTFKPKESLRFTFLTIGSRGDVQPYIALAKGLLEDGHRVKIATHGEYKEWIESHGIDYGYVGGDPAELMRICVENGTFTVSFLKEGLLKFRGWVDDLLTTSWQACQGTDVLIESPSAMGGYHIAEALGIPYFRAFTMTWTRTRAYPHAFAVPERKMGGGYNYMTYVLFDQVFWRATSGQINRFRKDVLHLDSTSLDKMEPHKIPFLYNFSPVVVPAPLDWPEWIRVTGYWFLNDADVSAKKWQPSQDLLNFLDSARKLDKKVVYIGFGSIVVSDPKAMTRCVIDAVVQSGVYAILSKGWSDRLHGKMSEVEEPLPKQIFPILSIPHDWLFRRIDAACHHGGAGTTGASLRAGIPTIIKPFFGDQFFWADRIEALGVGTCVRKLSVDHLSNALIAATSDRKQIERAKTLGEQIRAENGTTTAIEAIYRDLEYARSLVKRQPSIVEDAHARKEDIRSPSRASSGAPHSEDWSVVSDQEYRRSSTESKDSEKSKTGPLSCIQA